jgi:hypothetical protein
MSVKVLIYRICVEGIATIAKARGYGSRGASSIARSLLHSVFHNVFNILVVPDGILSGGSRPRGIWKKPKDDWDRVNSRDHSLLRAIRWWRALRLYSCSPFFDLFCMMTCHSLWRFTHLDELSKATLFERPDLANKLHWTTTSFQLYITQARKRIRGLHPLGNLQVWTVALYSIRLDFCPSSSKQLRVSWMLM